MHNLWQHKTPISTLTVQCAWKCSTGRCGHAADMSSLRSNTYACPYCRTHLSSEGTPAVDIVKKMKTVFQNCEECAKKVCLSDMRAHLNMCEQYVTKYGPLEELARTPCRDDMFVCPFCHVELDEDSLVQHCLMYHSSENRLVVCPICRLTPGGDSSYTMSFVKHLHERHSIYYDNYIQRRGHGQDEDEDGLHRGSQTRDINVVEEALIERVLDLSLMHYMRHSNRS
ncbi:E3 ubiquitin-protein ligase RNF125 isoform X3 [Ascaphus truei]|uniref:E3 ubiquitin-protein ligase RNF125 isoform X3 n=1 Tax=Ascaphus truei TaxID=8439 RepID=UPI003F59E865